MLLAEALAARKQALSDIQSFTSQAQGAAVRYEDDPKPNETSNPNYFVGRLEAAIEEFERLSVAINITNNNTVLTFDGRTMSVMQAIALREQLVFKSKHFRAVADHVQEELNPRRGYGRTSRTKEDIKQVADLDVSALRERAASISEQLRRLDSALQQTNWTTVLVAE